MKSSAPQILAINGGSSSIKFALFENHVALSRAVSGSIEGIGQPKGVFKVKGDEPVSQPGTFRNHAEAVEILIPWIEGRIASGSLSGIGHRVVHGGPKYSQPERITPEVIAELRRIGPFDPEHMPAEILLTEAFHRAFPNVPQIACFDTEFHHGMPPVARLLPIPRRYGALGVRRYGFHGLAYAYLMRELARTAGEAAANGRIILAHLGNGASMAAVLRGQSVDTTMALTPAAGLVMGTRSGDVDPGLAAFLARSEQMTPPQFDHMVNHESGLLGVSEISSDMRDLLARESGDVRAAEAVALFCYQAKKWIGAYAASLEGLDTLVFSGGIGENSPVVRARICEGLGFLGIELRDSRNAENAAIISADASRTAVRVIRADEEVMIAEAVRPRVSSGDARRPAI